MISTSLAISLLTVHWIADFLFQTDWMALNKSKSWKALCTHTLVYSLCFIWLGWSFVLATFFLHTLTDAVTSRATSKLWFFERAWTDCVGKCVPDHGTCWKYVEGRRHWFFVVIGLDQLIHGITLVLTWKVLNG